MSKLKDSFFGISYRIVIINTSDAFMLYEHRNWKLIEPLISELLMLSSHESYIRSYQSFESENKWLGFGRMKWNAENNVKWTSKYKGKEHKLKNIKFFNTEVWAPDWNHCTRNVATPEIYINVYHHESISKLREGILIALPLSIASKNEKELNDLIAKIQEKVPNSISASTTRKWTPGNGFVNRIEDMNPHELYELVYGASTVGLSKI